MLPEIKMDYLFFDIECSDGIHICEFGYVIANENFEVLKKEYFLINPEEKFFLGGKKGGLELNFTEREYRRSPSFPTFYETIKSIVENKEYKIIGFSMSNDVKFLETACKKYDKELFKFVYYDSQIIYAALFGNGLNRSLEYATESLQVYRGDIKMHRSDEDSLLTLRLVEAMCLQKNIGIEELLHAVPLARSNAQQRMEDNIAMLDTYPELLSYNKKKKILEAYSFSMTPDEELTDLKLKGKKICFSTFYETEQTRNCLVLMRHIVNNGGAVTFTVPETDIYIRHEKDEEIKDDPKRRYYNILHAGGHKINILSYNDLLKTLSLDAREIEKEPLPVYKRQKQKKEKYRTKAAPIKNTLGDYFKQQKIHLSSLYEGDGENGLPEGKNKAN